MSLMRYMHQRLMRSGLPLFDLTREIMQIEEDPVFLQRFDNNEQVIVELIFSSLGDKHITEHIHERKTQQPFSIALWSDSIL